MAPRTQYARNLHGGCRNNKRAKTFEMFDGVPGIAYHDAMSGFAISCVRAPEDLAATMALFEAYAVSLGINLSYQNFVAEMAAMPGKYAPPKGELLLARDAGGKAIGCVGLRPLPGDGVCEMKRLYVSPEGRGLGLGRALAKAVVEAARQIGYREMLLDTLPSLTAAIGLYEHMGFRQIPAYYDTPIAGTLFFRLML